MRSNTEMISKFVQYYENGDRLFERTSNAFIIEYEKFKSYQDMNDIDEEAANIEPMDMMIFKSKSEGKSIEEGSVSLIITDDGTNYDEDDESKRDIETNQAQLEMVRLPNDITHQKDHDDSDEMEGDSLLFINVEKIDIAQFETETCEISIKLEMETDVNHHKEQTRYFTKAPEMNLFLNLSKA